VSFAAPAVLRPFRAAVLRVLRRAVLLVFRPPVLRPLREAVERDRLRVEVRERELDRVDPLRLVDFWVGFFVCACAIVAPFCSLSSVANPSPTRGLPCYSPDLRTGS
jgi:hypothetical protein